MDKETFIEILQGALLSFDGVSEQGLTEEYGLNPKLAKLGFQLCYYLKLKEVNQ